MVGGAQERGHDVPVPQLGKLQPVEAKSVWAHEAHDFTPWLLENADALADVLGIDLELTINEHPVGGFSLDLLGKDLTHNCVLVVENQLVGTDHSHLGQLLTYAAGTEAATVVWVAAGFREEHRQALDWLNDLAGYRARFFGLEVRAVRIGDSARSPRCSRCGSSRTIGTPRWRRRPRRPRRGRARERSTGTSGPASSSA